MFSKKGDLLKFMSAGKRLFKSDAQSHIKSNLIIFVTANIIDAAGKNYRKPNEVDPSGNPVDPISTDLGGGGGGVLPPL